MSHLPQEGCGGMLEWVARLPRTTRKILIHINNTNPVLDEDAPSTRACARLASNLPTTAWTSIHDGGRDD
jgi:pyrroloquinoline quinone biosynthesis protein B